MDFTTEASQLIQSVNQSSKKAKIKSSALGAFDSAFLRIAKVLTCREVRHDNQEREDCV